MINLSMVKQLPIWAKGLVLVVILGVVWFGYTQFTAAKKPKVTYATATAERGTLVVSVAASGKISSVNGVDVLTQATGVVTNVYVKNGDTVKAGQKLADIQLDQDGQSALAKNYSAYLSSKNSLESSKISKESLEQAVTAADQAISNADAGSITAQQNLDAVLGKGPEDSDVKKAKLSLDAAHASQDSANANLSIAQQKYAQADDSITQAQASLNSAWLSYEQTLPTITAPVDGVLSNFALSAGNTISGSGSSSSSSSSSSQVVGTITLPGGQIQALVDLSEIDIVSVKPGQKATLTMDAFPDKTFTGKVVAINTNGSVSSNVTTYPTTIAFDNSPEGIYFNMAVDATIITNSKTDVITISTSAITTIEGVSTVQIMKSSRPTTVTVELGISNGSDTEITSGINEGDVVITATNSTSSSTSTPTSSVFGGSTSNSTRRTTTVFTGGSAGGPPGGF